jgi:hypothetical protein
VRPEACVRTKITSRSRAVRGYAPVTTGREDGCSGFPTNAGRICLEQSPTRRSKWWRVPRAVIPSRTSCRSIVLAVTEGSLLAVEHMSGCAIAAFVKRPDGFVCVRCSRSDRAAPWSVPPQLERLVTKPPQAHVDDTLVLVADLLPLVTGRAHRALSLFQVLVVLRAVRSVDVHVQSLHIGTGSRSRLSVRTSGGAALLRP